jgi:hypothetical protein
LSHFLYRCRSCSGTGISTVHKAGRIDQMGII